MKTFEEIKKEIAEQQESTRYFTREFLNTFIEEDKTSCTDRQTKAGSFRKVKASKFYNLNSCGYCIFLGIYNDGLQPYRINFFVNNCDDPIISRVENIITPEKAIDFSEYLKALYNADSYTIEKL